MTINPFILHGEEITPVRKLLYLKAFAGGGALSEYEVTGNPVAFNTNVAKPLSAFTIPFLPVQSGTGDPSPENVRPISGWSGVTAYRSGVNVYDAETYPIIPQVWINARDGSRSSNNIYAGTEAYIPCAWLRGQTVTLNKHLPEIAINPGVAFYDEEKEFLSGVRNNGTSGETLTFMIPTDAVYMRFTVPNGSTNVQIELGETASPYAEYTGESYPVTFPATGKNLLNIEQTEKVAPGAQGSTITISNGVISIDAIAASSRSYVVFNQKLPAGTYTIQAKVTGAVSAARLLTSVEISGSAYNSYYLMYVKGIGENGLTFTLPSESYIGLNLNNAPEESGNPGSVYDIQIESGANKTDYEPFTNTVYGGTLDAVNGVLTVEWAGFSKKWSEGQSATDMGDNITRKYFPMVDYLTTGLANNICNIASYQSSENAITHFYYSGSGSTNRNCRVFLPSDTPDTTEVTVITKLSQTYEIQLDPITVQTLIGDNTICTDTNGENTVKYLKKG